MNAHRIKLPPSYVWLEVMNVYVKSGSQTVRNLIQSIMYANSITYPKPYRLHWKLQKVS